MVPTTSVGNCAVNFVFVIELHRAGNAIVWAFAKRLGSIIVEIITLINASFAKIADIIAYTTFVAFNSIN